MAKLHRLNHPLSQVIGSGFAPVIAGRPSARRKPDLPKLQVSNGYSLDAAQNARLLTYILERSAIRKFVRRDVMEGIGLSEGQTESLASIGAASRNQATFGEYQSKRKALEEFERFQP